MELNTATSALALGCAAAAGGVLGYCIATRADQKGAALLSATQAADAPSRTASADKTTENPHYAAESGGYQCLTDATPLQPRASNPRPIPQPQASRAKDGLRFGSSDSLADACALVAAASATDVGMLHAPMTPERVPVLPVHAVMPGLVIPASATKSSRDMAAAELDETAPAVASARSAPLPGKGSRGRPVIIGVGGASGSGKTSVNRILSASLPRLTVASISGDNYYIPLTPADDPTRYNFDTPKAIDFALLASHLEALRRGESVEMPNYDFKTHSRLPEPITVSGVHVIIVDGIFTLAVEEIRRLCDFTVFTLEDLDVCLARRLKRDIAQRGRQVDDVLEQYERFVKPGYHSFVAPTMRFADLIVPRGEA